MRSRFRSSPGDSLRGCGNLPRVTPGEHLQAKGHWGNDERYGPQFRAEEIAVSVAAELVRIGRGGTGASLKDVERVSERFIFTTSNQDGDA